MGVRERILKVAEKLFAKKGYDATSVDEIAKNAKISKMMLYYYFKSKKNILKELITKNIEEIKSFLEINLESISSENLPEKIQLILEKLLEMCKQKSKIFRIALIETLKSSDQQKFFYKILQPIIQTIHKKIGSKPSDKCKTMLRIMFEIAPSLVLFPILSKPKELQECEDIEDLFINDLKKICLKLLEEG